VTQGAGQADASESARAAADLSRSAAGSSKAAAAGEFSHGHPRFGDAAHQSIAARDGTLAAWKAAFARYGTDAPSHVDGDFAVAIGTPSGGTFLAVDRFAIQTLCWRRDRSGLQAAPRADTLAGTDADLDPQALYEYLYFHVIPSPRTVFREISRLPPGHFAHLDGGTLTVAPYWKPHFEVRHGVPLDSLKAEFLRLVREAVARRLGDRPTGCYLSGGTDSSTVSGMVTRISGRPAETFSIGFDVDGYDEMHYARLAARHFGTRHHEYYVTPDDLVQGMPQVAASYDQPFGNSSAVPAFYCARAARGEGLERLLAGDGGDELFGGNVRYAKQRVFAAYDAIPSALRRGLVEPIVESGLVDRVPLLKKGASYVRQARVPMPDRMQSYNLVERIGASEIFTRAFVEAVDAGEPARHQHDVWNAVDGSASLVDKMLAYDWRYTLAENDLPKVVGSARLAGVDVGFPFLDDELLRFSVGLPPSYKVRGLKLRWFFKEALRGFLPDEILAKKKHGFGLPFGVWATGHAPLGALAADALGTLASRNIVRPGFPETLLRTYLPAHPGFYGELVWILTTLELWLRAHRPDYRLHER
jgi:asparagine synthase (glutamine-hydrolysing)